ncbi:pellicle/biofilm biosynthesis outer membrane protein PelC [Burkholderia sp. 3C]
MSGMERSKRALSWCAAAATATLLLAGCGTLKGTAAPALQAHDAVAVGAIANYTETPSAGQSAASIAANVLRADGLADVRFAPDDAGSSALFDTAQRSDGQQKLAWAQSQQIRYVLSGSVEEWRYKTGVDGEPVVGLTFELTDVNTGKVVWSATGTRNGWSRSSLAGVATGLIAKVLAPLAPRR